ncbi:hypothetical protein ACPXCE_15995 [Streptomyces sp. DT24]|uniref:hypothetical protein n=1 Tax=unclassified Streptomyces TaxID=2593676 RepID=UPI0023B95FB6|nr:hypothetical protein [Streptomyces sp. AM 4-1-1]WEH35177.1 hypothetical protein PZB75_18515 [Streptomyces sp. AM 4-1-1]
MSSLQRRAYGAEVEWSLQAEIVYRAECARVVLVDVLPVLVEYRLLQYRRDLLARLNALFSALEERTDAWLDRHGF